MKYVLILILFLAFVFGISQWTSYRSTQRIMNELKSEINGVVIEKIAVRESVGNTHLKLRLAKDVRKVHVGKSICQLVEVGDSIYKSKFSNCLFIIRDSTIIETTFRDLHDKTINSSYFNSEQFDLNCF